MLHILKKIKKWNALGLILFLIIAALPVQSQIVVVNHMRSHPVEGTSYLEMEREFKKVHEKRLEKGIIMAWYFYGKGLYGTGDEYDYITVDVYPNWEAYAKPGYTEEIMGDFDESLLDKMGKAREIVATHVYKPIARAENSKPFNFVRLGFMKVEQENAGAYAALETTYFKPFFEHYIDKGALNSWAIYEQLVPGGYGMDFNYVSSQGYDNAAQMDLGWENMQEVLKALFPDKTFDQIVEETYAARIMVGTEMWWLIEKVEPAPPGI